MNTLILGASTNPSRYSFKAVQRFIHAGQLPILIGKSEGEILGLKVQTGEPQVSDIDTVTVYLNASRQEQYIKYLIEVVQPRRIIFNPGAENIKLASVAKEAGIEIEHSCTLVLLATGQY